jgi:uncharacterized coiled-coil protein SlyX
MNEHEKNTEDLQIKVAFLEESLSHLSDEYYRQQKELDTLKNQYAILSERVKNRSGDDGGGNSSEDERPPHY